MKKTITTFTGDAITVDQSRKDYAPDLIIDHHNLAVRLNLIPVQLSKDNVIDLIKALCSTLPDEDAYELADLIRSDAFVADAKARVKRKES